MVLVLSRKGYIALIAAAVDLITKDGVFVQGTELSIVKSSNRSQQSCSWGGSQKYLKSSNFVSLAVFLNVDHWAG